MSSSIPELTGTEEEFRAAIASAPAKELYALGDRLAHFTRHPALSTRPDLKTKAGGRLAQVMTEADTRWRGVWMHRDNLTLSDTLAQIMRSCF
ncbi:hypothetical protein CONSTELLA_211 [Mycobacterium phage Constella]|uniref:Uncharacterized protein n=1 Tax=Mycobacterium phage Baka TaxID=2902882 RepID=G1D0I3_9CAUD|nr:hypothetical protein N857_gp204 [Mycobacterium phage Wanda]YP_009636396.1 hypothetical protein FGG20_gp207 [Mycobacterium phage Baka]ASZ74292.1 hypothetical protein SEA_SQUINT_217 [Mycobacterium phage Squint]AXF51700.1 hypothetical protein CONSTELLA_211 [Mycobacterium phage Constella]QBI98830.1 hypothetical protein SEA_BOBBY_200 [Mycobacterium phage Bobby]AEK08278.1 hypothetical protein PBI_BAKA_226 [Mycobacterium phage Baka]AIE57722.1 hypothetical protein PBI_WANDA_218 [Mycobacterium phag